MAKQEAEKQNPFPEKELVYYEETHGVISADMATGPQTELGIEPHLDTAALGSAVVPEQEQPQAPFAVEEVATAWQGSSTARTETVITYSEPITLDSAAASEQEEQQKVPFQEESSCCADVRGSIMTHRNCVPPTATGTIPRAEEEASLGFAVVPEQQEEQQEQNPFQDTGTSGAAVGTFLHTSVGQRGVAATIPPTASPTLDSVLTDEQGAGSNG